MFGGILWSYINWRDRIGRISSTNKQKTEIIENYNMLAMAMLMIHFPQNRKKRCQFLSFDCFVKLCILCQIRTKVCTE